MKDKKEFFVVRSPLRKQLGALWLVFIAVACWMMWSSKSTNPQPDLLFGVACASFLIGVYRCSTFSSCTFRRDVQEAEVHTYHFGFLKKVKTSTFDKVDILRRDAVLPYCQIYAYESKGKLSESLSAEEMKKYDDDRIALPGVVVVDHTQKKDCEKIIENIWRFYDKWQEPVVEEPVVEKVDEDDDDDYEDED